MDLTRRTLLHCFMSSAAAATLSHWPTVALSSDTLSGLTPLENGGSVTFDQFMALSKLICDDADLPVGVGRRFYQFFTTGTDLPLDRTYGEIAKAVSKETSTLDISKLQASGILNETGAKDLVTEIARSWFTGVVRISGTAGSREERITYFDALMYRPGRGYRNIPTTCGGEFGWWAFEPSPENRCCGDAWAKDEKNPKWGGRIFPEYVGGQVGKDEQQ